MFIFVNNLSAVKYHYQQITREMGNTSVNIYERLYKIEM